MIPCIQWAGEWILLLEVIYNPQVTFCGFMCTKINRIQNTAKLRRVITVVLVFIDSVITSAALHPLTLCTSPWLDHSVYRCAVHKNKPEDIEVMFNVVYATIYFLSGAEPIIVDTVFRKCDSCNNLQKSLHLHNLIYTL